jgi:hypothetical protein
MVGNASYEAASVTRKDAAMTTGKQFVKVFLGSMSSSR